MVPPRWATPRNPDRPSFGPAVAKIAELMKRPLMPWQRLVVDVALEVDPDTGEWIYDNVTITVPRQAGKTTLMRPVILHRMGRLEDARVFMAAQSRDKARSRWMDLTNDVKRSILWRDVHRKIGNMNEELRWKPNDSTVVPIAPNGDGMHGETPDLLAIDELWWYTADRAKLLQAAYVPGFLTKSAQAWKYSTAGTAKSWWLNTARATGRAAVEAGVTAGTAYFEWSLPDTIGGVAIDELAADKLVQACIDAHPSTMVRPASVWSAWTDLADRQEFIRAYANRTAEDADEMWQAIPKHVWESGISLRKIPADVPVALGFECHEDALESSVFAAWRDPQGQMLTELLATRPGTQWVAGFVTAKRERNKISQVASPAFGASREVADALERAGTPVLKVQTWDYGAACDRHFEQLKEGRWLHRGEPGSTSAASRTRWRKSGKSRMWADNGDPATALPAQTLAGWAYDHAPEPEKPLPKFWMG